RGGRDRVGRSRPSPGVSRSSGGVPAVEPDDPAQLLGVAAGALARQGLPAFREVEARLPEGVVLAEHRRPQRLGAVLRGERLVALGDDEPHGPFRPPELGQRVGRPPAEVPPAPDDDGEERHRGRGGEDDEPGMPRAHRASSGGLSGPAPCATSGRAAAAAGASPSPGSGSPSARSSSRGPSAGASSAGGAPSSRSAAGRSPFSSGRTGRTDATSARRRRAAATPSPSRSVLGPPSSEPSTPTRLLPSVPTTRTRVPMSGAKARGTGGGASGSGAGGGPGDSGRARLSACRATTWAAAYSARIDSASRPSCSGEASGGSAIRRLPIASPSPSCSSSTSRIWPGTGTGAEPCAMVRRNLASAASPR